MKRRLLSVALLTGLFIACSDGDSSPGATSAGSAGAGAGTGASGASGASGAGGAGAAGKATSIPSDPPTTVTVERSAEATAELTALQQQLAQAKGLTTDAFLAAHPAPTTTLGYDPLNAKGLDTIQASPLALTASELPTLATNGVAISTTRRFPSFTYGYKSIYAADLPLFISADSILHAVHRGFDDTLKQIEVAQISPDLDALLGSMRGALSAQAAALPTDVAADLDLFLGVGQALLKGVPPTAVAGGDAAAMKKLYDGALKHEGEADIKLFGVGRLYDFSQFTPRGHYTDTPELQRYFRAMMWFGRTDLRFLEPDEQGQIQFRKRQVLAAIAMRQLLDAGAHARFESIDGTIGAFAGEHDSMTVREVDALLAKLGAKDLAGVDALDDATIASAIAKGGFGAQRISSQIMINGTSSTLPLSSIFQLFGQRYTVDSHVFSNVVYDRAGGGSIKRMMPDPLDVAYAAIGHDGAASLLTPQLQKYAYAPDLESMRIIVDAHGDGYWEGSLATLWMSALRAMSPRAGDNATKLPAAMQTDAWSRRVLNTQLASWSELRHDTLLYAKQSYTGGASCEFPDAYVDPYPEVFARLGQLAQRGGVIASTLASTQLRDQLVAYYNRVGASMARLEGMAKKEREGTPFSTDDLAFVNHAVAVQEFCGGGDATGWYPELFRFPGDSLTLEPTIADVHTQPTDEAGNPVGKVLHVGTSLPRLMVVTVDTCQGPRAYAGLASTYAERVTDNFERLTDEAWEPLATKGVPDVPWLSPLLAK